MDPLDSPYNYLFKVIPFNLNYSGETYQSLMERFFIYWIGRNLKVYIVDMAVKIDNGCLNLKIVLLGTYMEISHIYVKKSKNWGLPNQMLGNYRQEESEKFKGSQTSYRKNTSFIQIIVLLIRESAPILCYLKEKRKFCINTTVWRSSQERQEIFIVELTIDSPERRNPIVSLFIYLWPYSHLDTSTISWRRGKTSVLRKKVTLWC